jgi:hypothetical protein
MEDTYLSLERLETKQKVKMDRRRIRGRS